MLLPGKKPHLKGISLNPIALGFTAFLILLRIPVSGQPSFLTIDSFSLPALFFTVDRLEQLYLADIDGLLTKYSPPGKLQFQYSNRPLGKLTHVDVTDPFNVLLYYPEYQSVILLDRTLSPTAQLNLLSLNLIDVQVIAMGNDQHIWLYDQAAFKLYKINPQGNISLESGDLSLVFQQPPQPRQLLVQNQYVYLYDPSQGVFQFDIFGQFIRLFDLKNLNKIQIIGSKLFYLRQPQQLGLYDFLSFRESTLTLPNSIEDFLWQKGVLYGKGEKLWIWKLIH